MARNSTTFTKETAPKGKGARKHKKTILKEAIGISGWERLTDFIINEGADKMVENIQQLKPSQYSVAFQALAEFVKPKLSRTELSGKDGKDLTITFKEVED